MDPITERQLHLSVGSRFENIELVQMTVDEALREGGVSEELRHWIGLALREAVANAIKHGHQMNPVKQVEIDVDLAPGELAIHVADRGPGFDPEGVRDPLAPENRFRADGRGIFYMKRFMDEVRYRPRQGGGTVVTLRKNIDVNADGSQER
jgi:serine/threonine-protein kinase RsbW